MARMKEGEKIRIVVVDDHAIVREGVTKLLQSEPDLSVVGEAPDGEQGVEVILKLRPDVAIVNLSMPRLHGIEVIRRLRQSNSQTRLAVLTIQRDPRMIEEAFRLGASAYLLQDGASRHLIEAIHVIMDGGVCISPLLEAVAEAERSRIAQELHDSTAQSLIGIKLNLELVQRYLDSANTEALDGLSRSKELVSKALEQIRSVLHQPHPPNHGHVH